MTDRRLTLRVSEDLDRALRDLAHEYRTDVSKVIRPWLRDLALSEHRDDVPDHLIQQLEREQRKERNSPKWDRIHFPSRVEYQFREAFENGDLSVDGGLGDKAVEELREIYVEEARGAYDDPELQEAAVEFVEAVARHAKEAAETSDFDKLDPEEMFERYAGVESGRTREGVEWDALVEDARDRLGLSERDGHYSAPATRSADPDSVARALGAEWGVSESLAQEAVEEAQDGGRDE